MDRSEDGQHGASSMTHLVMTFWVITEPMASKIRAGIAVS